MGGFASMVVTAKDGGGPCASGDAQKEVCKDRLHTRGAFGQRCVPRHQSLGARTQLFKWVVAVDVFLFGQPQASLGRVP